MEDIMHIGTVQMMVHTQEYIVDILLTLFIGLRKGIFLIIVIFPLREYQQVAMQTIV